MSFAVSVYLLVPVLDRPFWGKMRLAVKGKLSALSDSSTSSSGFLARPATSCTTLIAGLKPFPDAFNVYKPALPVLIWNSP
jgi:hypothetical protein